jgi:protein TonB
MLLAPRPERRGWILGTVVLAHLLLLGAVAARRTAPAPVPVTPPSVLGRLVAAPSPATRAAPVPAPKAAHPPRHAATPVSHPEPRATAAPAAPTAAPVTHDSPAPPQAAATRAERPAEAPFTPPRVEASGLDNPAPVYPTASRRLGEQGQVLLDVHILADGRVGEIRLRRSSGFERLDNAALAAVRHWHYRPARRGDDAIAFWYVQPIAFTLDP